MKRQLWIEALSYPMYVAFLCGWVTYVIWNCHATGEVVVWLLKLAYGPML